MSSTDTNEPAVFKFLGPKDRSHILASTADRKQKEAAAAMSSSEQTFIAVKPDGVQVCISSSTLYNERHI